MQVVKNLILKEVPGKYLALPVDIFTKEAGNNRQLENTA
jgi:hypothetical protein